MHDLFKENSSDVIGPDGTADILDFNNEIKDVCYVGSILSNRSKS